MRSYLVIPEGTTLIRVDASSPHYAASKARRGRGEIVQVEQTTVFPGSRLRDEPPPPIPGQLVFGEE